MNASVEITSAITPLIDWAATNEIPYGFEQR